MAVTGSGTQADPYIVTNYTDFISLSNHEYPSDRHMYIQFFDNEHPNQTIDCNTYGSEFKWDTFLAGTPSGSTDTLQFYVDINLNGCTIKNFLIKEGVPMFRAKRRGDIYGWANAHIIIHDGSLRNVFMGSTTSKIAVAENDGASVEFDNVSFSINSTGSTEVIFDGGNGYNMIFDNCALYLVCTTLNAPIGAMCVFTDTDIELHINNQNGIIPFRGYGSYGTYSSLTDCRIQGKIGGTTFPHAENGRYSVLGCATPFNSSDTNGVCKLVNCVVDLDLTDSYITEGGTVNYYIYKASGTTDLNTNVLCKSHYPSDGEFRYVYPSDWNYMTHEQIRNGSYLNEHGFTVVEVVGS